MTTCPRQSCGAFTGADSAKMRIAQNKGTTFVASGGQIVEGQNGSPNSNGTGGPGASTSSLSSDTWMIVAGVAILGVAIWYWWK